MYDPYSSNPYESEKSPKIAVDYKRNRSSAKKNGIGTVNAGGAVIIIIFVVLCLTIFGLLSFATAFADKKLADRNLQSIARYYKADAEAEEKLASVYGALREKIAASPPGDGFVDLLKSVVLNAFDEDTYEIRDASVWFKTNIGNSRNDEMQFYLSSGIEFLYDAAANGLDYKITEWKITSDSGFDYGEEVLDVWLPDFSWGDSDEGAGDPFSFGDGEE